MDHQIRHSYNAGLELKTYIGKHESYGGLTNKQNDAGPDGSSNPTQL